MEEIELAVLSRSRKIEHPRVNVIRPNGNVTINYLDTGEAPLSPTHLAFSAGLCMLFCGNEGLDGERKAIRHAMIVDRPRSVGCTQGRDASVSWPTWICWWVDGR